MNLRLKAFFLGHPGIIKAIEGLEHAGLDGAEDVVLTAVGAKFGVLAHLLPLETIADHVKQSVENAVDSKLDALITPDAPAVTQATATPAVAIAPQSDPRATISIQRRAAQLAQVTNPSAKSADDELSQNPPT